MESSSQALIEEDPLAIIAANNTAADATTEEGILKVF
jgi:hypothetical protein